MSFVLDHQIQGIDLKFCDLWWRWHHLSLPTTQFTPDLMESGVGFDGSAVGLKSVKAGEVFSPELIQQWINYKLEMEYYQVCNRPHPYEVSLYFDV